MRPVSDPPAQGDPALARVGAYLTVDLDAIQANHRRLTQELDGIECAAVLKANAYGLGLKRVAPALFKAGVRKFFLAQLEEAVRLRHALGIGLRDARIFDFNGPLPGSESAYLAFGVTPVLNSLGDIERWRAQARREGRPLDAAIHVDTGMARLGLPQAELDALAEHPEWLEGITPRYVMSHLASAEQPDDPLNALQLARFQEALGRLPPAPACFANSSGIFLGTDYHFDLGRPGVALYGVNPTPGRPNPMTPVVRLDGKIVQIREIDAPMTVGYGAAFRATQPTRVATVALGYGDGYLRSLSHRGAGYIGSHRVPVIGRVSMDLITLDVSAVPSGLVHPGALVQFLGPEQDLDAVAEQASTIGYEILTALGSRYHRHYLGG
ncbi:MAG: alanine racemase [Pseudomonadota bacterium]